MRVVALYARVSTQRQAEEATIESQIAQLENYAEANGFTIPATYRFLDEAVSGGRLQRPGLSRLRDAAMTGAFSAVLCLSPDRLSRNLGVQQFLLSEWKRLNISLIFINRPQAAETPQDALLLNIEGAFAEYERTVISDRMQRGRRHKLQQGEAVPYPAPYGYQYISATARQGSRWVVDQAQAAVIQQIYLWYTEERISLYQVTQRLNEQKTAAPGGNRWYCGAVQRIIAHPAYKGTAYYARTQRDYSGVGLVRKQGQGRLHYPRHQPRPTDEWIGVEVPALVDERLWQQAQEVRQMNTRSAARNGRRPYLLRSLLICGVCGSVLQGRSQQDRRYYRCAHGGKHRGPNVPVHTCTLRADVVESQIWQALTDLLRQPERIQEAWMAHKEAQTQPSSQISRWRQRQKALKSQRQRLLDAYQAEALSLEELTKRQNPIVLELRELETRLATSAEIADVQPSLTQFMAQIERALHSPDPSLQQEVIRLLIERIVVEKDALTVEHIIPTTDNSQLNPTQCGA